MKTKYLEQIERLEEERKYLGSQEELVENQRALEVQRIAEEYFRDSILETDSISFSGYSLDFKGYHKDYSYPKELFSISLKEDYNRTPSHTFKGMTISAYSSNNEGEWELLRLISIGKVAEILLANTSSILEELNKVYEDFKIQISALSSARWRVGKEIDELRKKVKVLDFNEVFEKMQEGMKIPLNEDGKRPRLQLSFNSRTLPLSFLKLENMTKSKKSTDVICEECYQQWNGEKYADFVQPTKYYKVRVKNIEDFINSYLI